MMYMLLDEKMIAKCGQCRFKLRFDKRHSLVMHLVQCVCNWYSLVDCSSFFMPR